MWAETGGPFSRAWRAAIRHCAVTETAINPFLWLVDTIITLYIWILIASAILSWLVAFNVVNARNPIVANIGEFLYRITEPALRPIRAVLPNLGGIDISPVILIFCCYSCSGSFSGSTSSSSSSALEMRAATR